MKVNVAHADVLVDGKQVGQSPLDAEVFVGPGAHTIEARVEGYGPAKQTVQAGRGSSQTVTLTLSAAQSVSTGAPSGEPIAGPAVSATAAPSNGGLPMLPPKEEQGGGPNKAIVIAGAGVAGASLIAGVVFTVVSNGKASDGAAKWNDVVKQRGPSACAQSTASGCPELHDLAVSKSTFGSLAGWSFIGAGVVGVATLVYTLAAPKAVAKSAVQITPTVTAREGGLVVRAVW